MAKCELCNEKKGRRKCPAINKVICPSCCASKREKEIDCPPTCEYLTTGKDFKIKKDIEKAIRKGLYDIKDDIFENKDAESLFLEFESFLAKKYYENNDVNDNKIYNTVSKIYAVAADIKFEMKYTDKYEEEIITKYSELDEKFPDLSKIIKKDVLLKTLDNIKKYSGGEYADKGYLRKVHIKNGGKVFF